MIDGKVTGSLSFAVRMACIACPTAARACWLCVYAPRPLATTSRPAPSRRALRPHVYLNNASYRTKRRAEATGMGFGFLVELYEASRKWRLPDAQFAV